MRTEITDSPTNPHRRCFQRQLVALAAAGWATHATASGPVLLGIDGEFGLQNSTSAQAIALGVSIAVDQINANGGVLGGRMLNIVSKDHRSIPARGIRNIEEFRDTPELVAVFGGRFSPVVIEQLPLLRRSQLPFLAVWSSADAVIDNNMVPNFVFRLSLRDSLAMPFMLQTARTRGIDKVGLLLTNTSWGRSNLAAADSYRATGKPPTIVATAWYNWQEQSLLRQYQILLAAGARAVLLVANDDEAAVLVREMAGLPKAQRVPILSHWGVTGGRFVETAGDALRSVDFSVVQTFSFFQARKEPLARFMATAGKFGLTRVQDIVSPVGVAHAYDMTHLLARAIDLAGSTDRIAIRDALERDARPFDGLVKRYAPAFTATRHEALDTKQLLMARYREDGALVPSRS